MDIRTFTVGPFAENTYLLTKNGRSVLVDPGFYDPAEFRSFRDKLEETGSELSAVLLTHAHIDHILGLEKVLKEYDVPVYLNHSDLYLWDEFPGQAAMFGFRAAANFDFTPENLPVQKEFEVGPLRFDVLFTPGHSPDHVSLYFPGEGVLIAGDVIFRESIGRTDLYKGDFDLLADSIRRQLYPLPDETTVYPGHGPETTIGHEKKSNPFVKAED
ncbi:MAG: MBL fold metallo-hydrolase [Balneolaceae bacterium]